MAFDLNQFLNTAAQIYGGSLQGQVQADQERKQRELLAQQQARQDFQLAFNVQNQERDDRLRSAEAIAKYVQPNARGGLLSNALTPPAGQLGMSDLLSVLNGGQFSNVGQRVIPPAPTTGAGGAAPQPSPRSAPPPVSPPPAQNPWGMVVRMPPEAGTQPAPPPAQPGYPMADVQLAGMPGDTSPVPVRPPLSELLAGMPVEQPAAQQPKPQTVNFMGQEYPIGGVDPDALKNLRSRYQAVMARGTNATMSPQKLQSIQEMRRRANLNPTDEQGMADLAQVVGDLEFAMLNEGAAASNAARGDYNLERKHAGEDLARLAGAQPDQMVPGLVDLWDRLQEQGKNYPGRSLSPALEPMGQQIEDIRRLSVSQDPAELAKAARMARAVVGKSQSPLSPKQQSTAVSRAFSDLKKLSAEEQLDPQKQRSVFDAHGVGYVFDGLDPTGKKGIGSEDVEKRWDDWTKRLDGIEKKSPEYQQAVLGQVATLSAMLGRSAPIKPGTLLKLGPLDQATYNRIVQSININATEEERAVEMMTFRRNQERRADEKHKADMKKLQGKGTDGLKKSQVLGELWKQVTAARGPLNDANDALSKMNDIQRTIYEDQFKALSNAATAANAAYNQAHKAYVTKARELGVPIPGVTEKKPPPGGTAKPPPSGGKAKPGPTTAPPTTRDAVFSDAAASFNRNVRQPVRKFVRRTGGPPVITSGAGGRGPGTARPTADWRKAKSRTERRNSLKALSNEQLLRMRPGG